MENFPEKVFELKVGIGFIDKAHETCQGWVLRVKEESRLETSPTALLPKNLKSSSPPTYGNTIIVNAVFVYDALRILVGQDGLPKTLAKLSRRAMCG